MTTTTVPAAVPVQPGDEPISTTTVYKQPVGRSVSTSLSSRWGKILVYTLVVLWTIPTFGILVSSFRPESDVKTSGWWTFFTDPEVTWDNYDAVLSSGSGGDNLWHFFLNSLEITIPSVILSIGIATLAAYAFSWMHFPGRDWLFVGTVALLMVPLQMALIPMLQLLVNGEVFGVHLLPLEDLDITEGIYGVWFAHVCFGMPLCIFILKNFISGLPKDIIEAARVDGAGHMTIFWRLVVPLSVPAIAALAIFQFMWIWNDYLVALIFTGRENAPITKQLAGLTGTRGQSWHLLTAAGMVSMILPIIVFFSLQRYFVRGLLAGAVKG
jgi:alpha-glucoside transport system permease protein